MVIQVPELDLAWTDLPAVDRPHASLRLLDISGCCDGSAETVCAYLAEKAAYAGRHNDLCHVTVIPGTRDAVTDRPGTRTYRLRGSRISQPGSELLASRILQRIVEHERPHVIEFDSQLFLCSGSRKVTRVRSGIDIADLLARADAEIPPGAIATYGAGNTALDELFALYASVAHE